MDTEQEKALPTSRRIAAVVGVVAVAGLAFGAGIVLSSSDRTAERAPGAAAPGSSSPSGSSTPVDVDLTPGPGTRITDVGGWAGHGSLSGVVTVTNSGASITANPLEVVLTVPTEDLHLYNRDDDRWDCSVEDHGMRCTIPDVVEAGESWPELLVEFVEDTTVSGTFTATAGGAGTGEASVEFSIDTSL
jgi:hypothetical protein